ncbi:hypothetical protein J4434_07010 [Candidatus Woesearchaeota archaeon]|nr:hypothetical protein [Candidatus Woesearchaeota archaeon]
MHAEELKVKLRDILGNQIEFNKEFDKYTDTIKNIDDNLIEWCKIIKEGKLRANRAPNREDALVFIKKIGSSNRCIVIKIKNGIFTEVHLADHAYYDKLRKELGLKSDSKYY